jgi:uncharacterized protein (DUF4415 family)
MAKSFGALLTKPATPVPEVTAPKRNKSGAGRPTNSPKGEQLIPFHIDDDLLGPLDLEVVKRNFERGKSSSSRREVINEALRAFLKVEKG